jgi:hypothetical protein
MTDIPNISKEFIDLRTKTIKLSLSSCIISAEFDQYAGIYTA